MGKMIKGIASRTLTIEMIIIFFLLFFAFSMFVLQIKKCVTEATHRKTQTPIAAKLTLIETSIFLLSTKLEFAFFTKFICRKQKKWYSIPL